VGLSRIVFEINGDFSPSLRIFLPLYLMPSLRALNTGYIEFCNGVLAQRSAVPDGKKSLTIRTSISIRCIGQTRQTARKSHITIALCSAASACWHPIKTIPANVSYIVIILIREYFLAQFSRVYSSNSTG